jgi:hypothetical protein
MYYINHKHETFGSETIDEAKTRKEALYLLNEYRLSGGNYYISKREIY